jgi:Outer membrane protein beta-barrel domain
MKFFIGQLSVGLLFCSAVFGQAVSVGVKLGGPLTDAFHLATDTAAYRDTSFPFVVGPTAEFRLPFGFGIEVDALYRNLSYDFTNQSVTTHSSASSWEFPVLAKYRSAIPLIKPYVVGGLAFDHLANLSGIGSELQHSSNTGIVLGVGFEIKALVMRISPEIRYTRWTLTGIQAAGPSNGAFMTNKNQADFLVGFTF